jgi:hypothetical protein
MMSKESDIHYGPDAQIVDAEIDPEDMQKLNRDQIKNIEESTRTQRFFRMV